MTPCAFLLLKLSISKIFKNSKFWVGPLTLVRFGWLTNLNPTFGRLIFEPNLVEIFQKLLELSSGMTHTYIHIYIHTYIHIKKVAGRISIQDALKRILAQKFFENSKNWKPGPIAIAHFLKRIKFAKTKLPIAFIFLS